MLIPPWLSETLLFYTPDVMNLVCDSRSKNTLWGNLMMHMKRITLYFGALIAHFVPLPACHVHGNEVSESNPTWYIDTQSALVLDLT